MNTEHTLRIKSAMIIYSLETSLGNYVINSKLEENLSESTSEIIRLEFLATRTMKTKKALHSWLKLAI